MIGDVIERFPSKSSSAVYEVTDRGENPVWCNCPGHRFTRNGKHSCKHVEELVKRGTLDADYRIAASKKGNGQVNDGARGQPAPAPRTLEAVRAETPVVKKGAPEVMLAHQVEKAPFDAWTEQFSMEMKLDGMRLVCVTTDSRTLQYSRLGNLHDHEFLRSLTLPAGTILDGELCASGDQSSYASGRRADDRYVVFDLMQVGEYDLRSQPWTVRREALEMLVREMGEPRIQVSKVFGRPDRALAEKLMSTGHEGVMLKRMSSVYEEGRSWAWLKAKATQTYDVAIVDMEALPTSSERIAAGWKGLRYGVVIGGKMTIAGSLGVTGPPEELAEHIGKVAEVRAYGQSKSGALRHPYLIRYRDPGDKSPAECVLDA